MSDKVVREVLCARPWMSYQYRCLRRQSHGGDHLSSYLVSESYFLWDHEGFWQKDFKL